MKKGFTLAEVLIGALLLGILSFSFLMVVRIAYRMWYKAIPIAQASNFIRGGIDELIRDIRTADAIVYPDIYFQGVATSIVYLSSSSYIAIYRNTQADIATHLYKRDIGDTFTLNFNSSASPPIILMENVSSFSVYVIGSGIFEVIATFTYPGDETQATVEYSIPFKLFIRKGME